jgi:hypothetical protein
MIAHRSRHMPPTSNSVSAADERHSDLPFAINDAFHRARRQLQDHVRKLQGEIKTNRARPQI